MNARASLVLAALLLSAGGCKDDKAEEEKKKAAAAEQAKASTKPAADAKNKNKPQTNFEVPTEEDFEEAVEQQITAESNLDKELDLLEQQIGE